MRARFPLLLAFFMCLVLAPVAPTHAGETGSPPAAEAGRSAETFLIRVDRTSRDDLPRLLEGGIPVVMETNSCFFVEGNRDHLRWLDDHGYTAAILDDSPATSDYLQAGLLPNADMDAVHAIGTVLWSAENWILVRIPRGVPFESLAMSGMMVVRLPHETMEMPRPAPARPAAGPRKSGAALSSQSDVLVQKMVDQVLPADIDRYWQDLTDNPPTGTRYSTHQGCRDAADYCYDVYVAEGIPVEYQEWNPSHAPNVIGTQEGGIYPGRVYIIEGHLDDLPSTPPAPGADDDASGSVTVLEAANVMSCYTFKSTVKYLNVTGEESGLNGSEAYVDDAWARGEDVRGVLNFDMNGWEGNGIPDPEDLDLDYNAPSQWIAELFTDSAVKYGTGLAVKQIFCPSMAASDHWPFWQKGWHAILGITDNEGYCGATGNYPYYHTSDDTIANCGDPTFFYATVKTAVATLAEMAEPFKVATDKPFYACGSSVQVVAGDRDLDTDPGTQETVTVEVWSDTETTPEVVTLAERGLSSAFFDAVVPTTLDPPVGGDGVLSVAPGDTINARYVDALDCDGATNVTYTAVATVDCTNPLISNVSESGVTDTQATITWLTDEDADSVVHWGETTPPGNTESDAATTTSHQITLTGLQECTIYYYSVESEDIAGNVAADDNGGLYYHFETLGDFGEGLQPCHAGQVSIGAGTYSCSDTATFRVTDLDLNTDPLVAETTTLSVTSTTETTPEVVLATETGPNTSVFTASIATAPGAPAPDGVLQTSDGDVLTVTYRDADDGTGAPASSFDTAALDCREPRIENLRVEAVTDQRLTVRFETEEPGDTVVEWGDTPALGQSVSQPSMTTSHAVLLNDLDTCGTFYLRVRSTDVHGNTAVGDLGGSPHAVHTWLIPGLYWHDDFEGDVSGWTLEGEWEVGEPQGLGGAVGGPDPSEAYNNRKVLGHDLSGQGAWAGDYEPLTTESARSPSQDGSSWTNTRLLIHRRLNVGAGDNATLWLWTGAGRPIYSSNGQTVSESGFTVMSYDIGMFADGSPSVFLQLQQQSDGSLQYSGWNVDDVIFKDGSLPDYGPCGGCGLGPSFGGAVSATDDDACGATGVTVSWNPPAAWGTGESGTYAVYRGTTPDFVPSGANIVAAGVSGLAWTDTGAPEDQTLYYVVRAENDETCSSGPNNGGATDDNDVHAEVGNSTSQPAPGGLDSLRVSFVNHAHVRLSWEAAAGASGGYRIYRSDSPQPGTFVQIAETGTDELFWEDLDQGNNSNSYYYLVRAVNACGVEGE